MEEEEKVEEEEADCLALYRWIEWRMSRKDGTESRGVEHAIVVLLSFLLSHPPSLPPFLQSLIPPESST